MYIYLYIYLYIYVYIGGEGRALWQKLAYSVYLLFGYKSTCFTGTKESLACVNSKVTVRGGVFWKNTSGQCLHETVESAPYFRMQLQVFGHLFTTCVSVFSLSYQCQYLHFCTSVCSSKSSDTYSRHACQYLHFCTSVSICTFVLPYAAPSLRTPIHDMRVSICTCVPVKQANWVAKIAHETFDG
jgi:hypothetical protein